jgi:transitional endoplasmic reticulum ATPase
MSFNSDKKQEHEKLAEKALARKDYAQAFFHTTKAADFTFNLAEQSDGNLARAYLRDANDLLDIAAKLKQKAREQKPAQQTGTAKEASKELSGQPESPDKANGATSRWVVTEKPDVAWDDVKGLHEPKAVVQDRVIRPLKYPELQDLYKVRAGGGLLLYGPPGNGKTMFAKALAAELDAVFLNVPAKDLKNKYVGDSEKAVSLMFEEARKHDRCVLFLDEAEAILRKRGNQKISTVEQFLAEADGVKSNDQSHCLLLLLASNRPWLLDSAVVRPGRIGVHVYVGLPDEETRRAIIETQLADVPLEDVSVDRLVELTEGFTCAEIGASEGVCSTARLQAFRRAVDQLEQAQPAPSEPGAPPVPMPVVWADFEQAFGRVVPYGKRFADEMKQYEEWAVSGSSEGDSDDE